MSNPITDDMNWENPCYECQHELTGDCPEDCPVIEITPSHCPVHGDFEGTTCMGCVKS